MKNLKPLILSVFMSLVAFSYGQTFKTVKATSWDLNDLDDAIVLRAISNGGNGTVRLENGATIDTNAPNRFVVANGGGKVNFYFPDSRVTNDPNARIVKGTIKFKVRRTAAITNTDAIYILGKIGTSDNKYVTRITYKEGNYYCKDGSNANYSDMPKAAVEGQWHEVAMYVDCETHLATSYFDGELWVDSIPFQEEVDFVNRLESRNDIDDVEAFNVWTESTGKEVLVSQDYESTFAAKQSNVDTVFAVGDTVAPLESNVDGRFYYVGNNTPETNGSRIILTDATDMPLYEGADGQFMYCGDFYRLNNGAHQLQVRFDNSNLRPTGNIAVEYDAWLGYRSQQVVKDGRLMYLDYHTDDPFNVEPIKTWIPNEGSGIDDDGVVAGNRHQAIRLQYDSDGLGTRKDHYVTRSGWYHITLEVDSVNTLYNIFIDDEFVARSSCKVDVLGELKRFRTDFTHDNVEISSLASVSAPFDYAGLQDSIDNNSDSPKLSELEASFASIEKNVKTGDVAALAINYAEFMALLEEEGVPLGFSEVVNGSLIKCYPNPARDVINIQSEKVAQVQFFDMTGRLVKRESLVEGLQSVDVSALKAGNYILRSVSGSTIQNGFISIQ